MIKLFYIPPDENADPYHDIGVMLNVVEINVAIITACGPALRPLFRTWLPTLFGATSGQYLSDKQSKLPYGNSYFAGTGRDTTGTGGGGIALKSMRASGLRSQHTECRSISPSGSEEEIMTYNGILRTTQVRLNYSDNTGMPEDSKNGGLGDMGMAR